MATCVPTSPVTEVILYAWAMNMLAKVMYIILPSRLNEYPSGRVNETILSLHPNLSISSTNFGNTASLLAVLKAMAMGELRRRSKTGRRFLSTR